MSESPRLGGDSPLRAVAAMALVGLVFPLMNANAKYLGAHYPLAEVVWARFASHVVVCVLLLGPRFGRDLFRTRHPVLQGWRGLMLFTASASYYLGVQYVDLSTAAAISFSGPIVVTALSVPMLREKVGIRRWTAVMVGFAGALVISWQPEKTALTWGAILILIDVVVYAFYQILSRRIGGDDKAATSTTLAGLGAFLVANLLLPFFEFVPPRDTIDALLFVSLGVTGLVGHYLVTYAYQWASASLVAPMIYFELAGAAVLSWVVFGEIAEGRTWVGAAIIIGSGLYITWREQVVRRKRAAAAAVPAK